MINDLIGCDKSLSQLQQSHSINSSWLKFCQYAESFLASPGKLRDSYKSRHLKLGKDTTDSHLSPGYKSVSCQQRVTLPVSEVRGQRSRGKVSSLFHINTHQLCLFLCSHSTGCFSCILLFYLALILQVGCDFPQFFPSSALSGWLALGPPRQTHSRTDPTIAPILPPN